MLFQQTNNARLGNAQSCRQIDLTAAFCGGRAYKIAFKILEGILQASAVSVCHSGQRLKFGRKIALIDGRAFAEHKAAFQDVEKLPHVARKIILVKQVEGVPRYCFGYAVLF